MFRAGVIAISVLLTGCAAAQRQEQQARYQEALAKLNTDSQACVSRYSESAAEAVPRAKCLNAADNEFKNSTPAADLIALRMAKRLELAERRAAGKITFAQASLEFAELISSITTEAQRRMNANMSVAAQQQAAAAATVSAIAANSPRSCTRFGNTVTCF